MHHVWDGSRNMIISFSYKGTKLELIVSLSSALQTQQSGVRGESFHQVVCYIVIQIDIRGRVDFCEMLQFERTMLTD